MTSPWAHWQVTHPILASHLLDHGPLLYVGSPHMRVDGLSTPEAGSALLTMLLMHATSPAFTYFHAWDGMRQRIPTHGASRATTLA